MARKPHLINSMKGDIFWFHWGLSWLFFGLFSPLLWLFVVGVFSYFSFFSFLISHSLPPRVHLLFALLLTHIACSKRIGGFLRNPTFPLAITRSSSQCQPPLEFAAKPEGKRQQEWRVKAGGAGGHIQRVPGGLIGEN